MSEGLQAVILSAILIAISIPILLRTRTDDRWLPAILLAALLLKLGGSLARYFVISDVYGGAGDATGYHEWGVLLADRFRSGSFDLSGLASLSDTDFIRFFTGIVYTIIGPTQLGGFLVYSWLAFWGLFLFYRAFRTALPEVGPRLYVLLLFFLPSLVFWPSSIGKEAWMVFTLGVTTYGASKILTGTLTGGLISCGVGLWLTAIVRPHVAGILAISIAIGYLARRGTSGARGPRPFARPAAFAMLVLAAVVLVNRTESFLEEKNVDTSGGTTVILEQTAERTAQGGSEFDASVLESPANLPVAVVTVLFRPALFEAHNPQAAIAALETTLFMLLLLVRFRAVWAVVSALRRRPFIGMILVYTALFILVFSAVANFGLLVRERVQLLPFFLVLLSVPRGALARQAVRSKSIPAVRLDRSRSPVARDPAPVSWGWRVASGAQDGAE